MQYTTYIVIKKRLHIHAVAAPHWLANKFLCFLVGFYFKYLSLQWCTKFCTISIHKSVFCIILQILFILTLIERMSIHQLFVTSIPPCMVSGLIWHPAALFSHLLPVFLCCLSHCWTCFCNVMATYTSSGMGGAHGGCEGEEIPIRTTG